MSDSADMAGQARWGVQVVRLRATVLPGNDPARSTVRVEILGGRLRTVAGRKIAERILVAMF